MELFPVCPELRKQLWLQTATRQSVSGGGESTLYGPPKERCGGVRPPWLSIERATRPRNRMAVTILEHEPLSRHTVFGVGGPARFLITAEDRFDIASAVAAARERKMPWVIIGAGSNTLVSDRGFPGMVIRPRNGTITVTGTNLTAEAGAPMARVVADAIRLGLAGFEWAIGVPGTIGGSVRGNAGCFGSEMADVVRSVTVLNTLTGGVEEWSNDACEFAYRDSAFKRHPEFVVLAATIALTAGSGPESQRLVYGYTAERTATQDIGGRTAGCMFKNVPWSRRGVNRDRILKRFPPAGPFAADRGLPAGFLIDQIGLKGFRVGGAEVSRRHGNFFLNVGGATAEHIVTLAGIVKERVHRHFGILLEEEVQLIGF